MADQFVFDIRLRPEKFGNPFRELFGATERLAPGTIVRLHVGKIAPDLIASYPWHNENLNWQFCAEDESNFLRWQEAVARLGGDS
jgi:hypothetical protein